MLRPGDPFGKAGLGKLSSGGLIVFIFAEREKGWDVGAGRLSCLATLARRNDKIFFFVPGFVPA
jgi:hypothetical protein